MGTSFKTIESRCKKCETSLVRYFLKSTFIDDFADECPKCAPGEAIDRLRSWDRSAAREDELYEQCCE
jgi:hypothetical protein